MDKITVDVDDNGFVVSGNLSPIINNARKKLNFSSIGAVFKSDTTFIVEFDESNKSEVYDNLKRLFEKFEIEYQHSNAAVGMLQDSMQQTKDFADFSDNARNIRNANHDVEKFQVFTGIVEKSLKRGLYPLQLLSAYHLAYAQNACNFSVPGAGKTSIVYASYAYLKSLPASNSKHVKRLLIICPLAAFGPWKDEYKECFGRDAKSMEMVGLTARERSNHFISPGETELTIISYQSASSDVKYIKNFLQRGDTMVVLDEAHKIKNTDESAVWSNAILSIADFAKSRVVLTGTPAPNGYGDLWNLFEFIWPHRDIIDFPLHYLNDLDNNPDDKKKLIENIQPFFIRIKKSHLMLPEPIFNDPIIVPMAEDQRKIYKHIEDNYVSSFERNDSGTFSSQLQKAKTVRLRQCLTNPNLLKKPLQEFHEVGITGVNINDRDILKSIENYQSIPNKFVKVADLIKKIIKSKGPAGKVVVWAYFIGNIHDFSAYLRSLGIESQLLYGATPNENDDTEDDVMTREKIIREFHNENCPYKVIIANPFAVGESISLHKACHNAIYLEKDFNATNYMQSKDRTHRYGLEPDDEINYYFFLSEDSIDSVIHSRVLEKEERMLEIIENEEIPLLEMDMSSDEVDSGDIRAIIEDYRARKSPE